MDAVVAALITGLITLLVSGPLAYYFGLQRSRHERLDEQRALVIAELSRLLWRFQMTALLGTNPNQPPQVRAQRIAENQQAMTELSHYVFAHALWLDAETNEIIESFLLDMTNTLNLYEANLDEQGYPSDVGIAAARHIFEAVPAVREKPKAKFRAILYPPPWYDAPLRFLERTQARNRKPDADASGGNSAAI
jgi:hypothetical protein